MRRVNFKNSRGLNLVGDFYDVGTSKGVVIAHGFTGDRLGGGKYERLAAALNRVGYNALAFDFSGCGESDDDSLTVEKQVDDLKAAIHFIQENGSENVGLVGYSLGGLVSLITWSPNVSALVLWAPVTSAKENPRSSYSSVELEEVDRTGFITREKNTATRARITIDGRMLEERKNINQENLLSRITCPVLIIQGDHDKKVRTEASLSAMKYLGPSSKLIIIPGGTHDLTGQMDVYIPATLAWITTNV